jgi:ATP-dependent helicase/nuclease subunit B
MPPTALARERALAKEAAAWVADWERAAAPTAERIIVEAEGRLTFDMPGGRPSP